MRMISPGQQIIQPTAAAADGRAYLRLELRCALMSTAEETTKISP
jgi:hypothetical protein